MEIDISRRALTCPPSQQVLYDLLMNMLEERGVSNDFAAKLSDFCTEYEHKCYIALLEGLRGFVSK